MAYNEWTGTWDEWTSLAPYKKARYKTPKKDDKATPKTKPKKPLDPNKPAKAQKERTKPPGMKPLKPSGKTAQRKRSKAKE